MPKAKTPDTSEAAGSIGGRIRELREQAGLSLTKLSEIAGVSKGYLWSIEKGANKSRPSGETLYRIAEALGTTMTDLLGRETDGNLDVDVPPSLEDFARDEGLSESDKMMLAQIHFRGQQPEDSESWGLIWQAIRHSIRAPGAAR